MLANTPKPPYYVVTFSSQRYDSEQESYDSIAATIDDLAKKQPGFLGVESARDSSGFGITLSYWEDRKSILEWKNNAEHLVAQKLGKDKFYQNYTTRIAKVEREYSLH